MTNSAMGVPAAVDQHGGVAMDVDDETASPSLASFFKRSDPIQDPFILLKSTVPCARTRLQIVIADSNFHLRLYAFRR